MKKEELPNTIPVFPLSNFIIFPKTTVPLNIFEPRYVEMINDKTNFFNLGFKNDWKKNLPKEISDKINIQFSNELKDLEYE